VTTEVFDHIPDLALLPQKFGGEGQGLGNAAFRPSTKPSRRGLLLERGKIIEVQNDGNICRIAASQTSIAEGTLKVWPSTDQRQKPGSTNP